MNGQVFTDRRNLPHLRQDGATYFVTFRLNDSLPAQALKDLKILREEWEREHPPSHAEEQLEDIVRTISIRAEEWLDQGHGSCLLAQQALREPLERVLHGKSTLAFELGAYVIMPNHAHALARPLAPADEPLEMITRRWKGASSRGINEVRGESGSLWFGESHDRIVRDAEHLYRCVQYIGRNPIKAGLAEGSYARWISPEWEALGWGFKAKDGSRRQSYFERAEARSDRRGLKPALHLVQFHTRKRAPSFLPNSKLAPMMVTARNTMAHTPRAEATYLPVPMSWNNS